MQYFQRHIPPQGENGQFGQPQLVQHLVDIRNITDLWENRFVFKYDASLKDEIKFDDIDFYEKQQDELRNYQRAKWVDCQFYWFQQNKKLHPRYRKQEWVHTATYEGNV